MTHDFDDMIEISLSPGYFEWIQCNGSRKHHKFQEALSEFQASLKQDGLVILHAERRPVDHMMIFKMDGPSSFPTFLSGEFSVYVSQIAPFITALAAWFAARNGRKIKIKIGDIEAEARTVEEVQRLFQQVAEFQRNKAASEDHEEPEAPRQQRKRPFFGFVERRKLS